MYRCSHNPIRLPTAKKMNVGKKTFAARDISPKNGNTNINTTTMVTQTATSGTQITATDVAPPPAGQGVLLLSASPWGDIEKIVNAQSQAPIDLSDEDRMTPARIALDPGKYVVTVKGPADAQTVDVQIEAGKSKRVFVPTGTVNFDELTKEVSKP